MAIRFSSSKLSGLRSAIKAVAPTVKSGGKTPSYNPADWVQGSQKRDSVPSSSANSQSGTRPVFDTQKWPGSDVSLFDDFIGVANNPYAWPDRAWEGTSGINPGWDPMGPGPRNGYGNYHMGINPPVGFAYDPFSIPEVQSYINQMNLSNAGDGGGYTGDDGGGGGGGGQSKITWRVVPVTTEGAPSWWKALVPSEVNENTEYIMSLNAMIPFLSPEDQRRSAELVYQYVPEYFGHLGPGQFDVEVPPVLNTSVIDQFTNRARGAEALRVLEELREETGVTQQDFGPGYQYLRNVVSLNEDYGGQDAETRRTRQQQAELLNAVSNLTNTTGNTPFSALAAMFTSPGFTAGSINPYYENNQGQKIFGARNKRL